MRAFLASLIYSRNAGGTASARFSQWMLLLGGFLLLLSFVKWLAAIDMALRVAGLAALLTGGVAYTWQILVDMRDDVMMSIIDDIVGLSAVPHVMTNRNLAIVYRNPAAAERYSHSTLQECFKTKIANPDGVLERIKLSALAGVAVQEELITARGVLHVAARQTGADTVCWRIDEMLEQDSDTIGARGRLPFMTVDADGAILSMSREMRDLIGHREKHLADVFDDLPLRSGGLHRLKSKTGDVDVAVYVANTDEGRMDVVAFEWLHRPGSLAAGAGWEVIEDLPVPLLKLGMDGTILESNRGARGLLRGDVGPGTKLTDFLDGLGRPVGDWISETARAAARAQPQFLRGTGDRQDLFVQVALCRAQGGDVPHVIAVMHDVTEFKVLEAQFVQSQKMQAIGQLAGGVAHDFNNLLTAISGHCDLLLLRHTPGDDEYSDLTQIHQNANRAASLVGQLLAYSRKQEMRLETLVLRDVLADLTHLLNRLVGEQLHLKLMHDPKDLYIKADKRQLEQVIMNLIVNARDAMDKTGEIVLRTELLTLDEPVERDRATVPAGDWVVIHVEDQGCGIAPELLSHVFEPFYTTKGVGEGTGLGLSTVYGIIKQTGGFIFVESTQRVGSTFSVFLPSHKPKGDTMPNIDTDASQTEVSHQTGVVLLVEDEAPVRAFACRALKLRGYEVIEADCGEAALEVLADPEVHVDLVVSDVVMPGIDGPTWVTEALKTRSGLKVVFMSGYAEDSIREHRQAIPRAAFLPKPFSLNDLLSTVQDHLG